MGKAMETYVNTIIRGDSLDVLKGMPAESVDMTMTSPPYWALRDYGVKGQLGLEETYDDYIQQLCAVFDEVRRVTKETGTCWVNLGDTYSGSNNGNNDHTSTNRYSPESYLQIYRGQKVGRTSLPNKSLVMIPFRFAIEMVNRGWILRNTIIWHKPNCMPSSVRDRFTVDFEYLFFFSKSRTYYFERQFDPYTQPLNRWGGPKTKATDRSKGNDFAIKERAARERRPNEKGRNKRCVWRIPTRPHPDAHFAVYPEELCVTPIQAGCPEMICKKCGKAREKVFTGTSPQAFNIRVRDVQAGRNKHTDRKASRAEVENYREGESHVGEGRRFVGYTDCHCNAGWNPGLVLDPFAGSGTTLKVARALGRNYLGIELNPEYIRLAEQRLAAYRQTA